MTVFWMICYHVCQLHCGFYCLRTLAFYIRISFAARHHLLCYCRFDVFDVTVMAGEVCDLIFGMGARGLSSVKIVIGRAMGCQVLSSK